MHDEFKCDCEKFLKRGLKAIKSEKWEEAISEYESALKVHDDNHIAWCNLGACYSALGDHKKALECLDKSILYNPRHMYTWNIKGAIMAKEKNFIEALRCFDFALSIDPSYKQAQQNKETALKELAKQLAGAKKEFK